MYPQPVAASGRVWLFPALLVLSTLGLIYRLFVLQVVRGPEYAEAAFENRVSRISDPASRGIIYDRRGVSLAVNVPSFNIVITPASLPENPAHVEAIYRQLSEWLDLPIRVPGSTPAAPCTPGRGIADLVDEGRGFQPFEPVKIGCDVPRALALRLRSELDRLPGVGVQVEPLREYSTGSLTAALVGYMAPIPDPNESEYFKQLYDYYTGRGLIPGRDRIGVTGVEATLQDVLAGQNGSLLVERDVGGQILRVLTVETATVPGQNVQLTIDIRLQAAAQAILTRRMDYVNGYLGQTISTSGVAIAMNPQTGEILAMVSWPTYDNNRFARTIDYEYYVELSNDPWYPMLNHAVQILYPPGSVFKIVTAAGVLEEGVIDPERELFDPGKIVIRDAYYPADLGRARDFVCWKSDGHEWQNFVQAIANSCNVYFYKVGGGFEEDQVEGLGIDALGKWMGLFGFGQATGVELPGELNGSVPSPDWKRITWGESWSTGDTYNAVIGQGYVAVTPLQMLNAYNVIANGGRLIKPTLIDKILDGEGRVISDTQPIVLSELPISAESLALIRAGMREVVTAGTLAGDPGAFGEHERLIIDVPGVNVAGKTGTAEYCDQIAYPRGLCVFGRWPKHAWTAAYAPYEDPEISVIVFVYNGLEGSQMAGPIAGDILRTYFELKALDASQGPPDISLP